MASDHPMFCSDYQANPILHIMLLFDETSMIKC